MKVVLVLALVVGNAHADSGYSAGLLFRSDRDTQSTRISAAVRSGRIGLRLVADPLGYQRVGEQSDTDALVEIDLSKHWTVNGGWRVSTMPVLGRRYWNHSAVVGISAPLPTLFWGHVRVHCGAEIAVLAFRHGRDLPSTAVWDVRDMESVGAAINAGIFVRAEMGKGL